MALFQRGFGKYLQSGEFADVALVYGNTEFRAHKIILAYSSDFFARLFSGSIEGVIQHLILIGVFPAVLRYMYTGSISMSTTAAPILAVADQYLIASLRQLATNYLSKVITREARVVLLKITHVLQNVFEILPSAIAFQTESVVDKCVNCIAKNFYFMKADQDYNFLPLSIFKQLLQHPYLAVKDEWLLYQTVCRYIAGHSDLTPDQVQNLMESIRYRWMTYDQLQQVEGNSLVPRALIVEALLARLKVHEGPNSDELQDASDNPRLQKRALAGLEFEYTSDFDDKGIIYWIATHGGREPWVNPHNAGWIRVSASSSEKGNVPDLVSRDPYELWTKDVPASWFTIDLIKRTVLPTHYTLRHGPFKADSLRTWDLQGSLDGQNWHVLRRHANDKTLNGNWATHTWPLPGVTRAFRYFRILQTGRNSNNHNFLVLSGFELYGVVYEQN